MVVFTCNHCGDSLQKPKVEKHYTFVCRTTKSLTCVDCFKDFRGEEYVVHTKCLTEDERYAAKGTYVNGITKKGEVKQESWMEMIKSILNEETNLKPACRNLLNNMSNHNNVPRKKNKFLNFIKSTTGGRANMVDVEEVWNLIENYKSQAKNTEPSNLCKDTEENLDNGFRKEEELKNDDNSLKKRKTESKENTSDEILSRKKQKTDSITISLKENECEKTKFRFQDAILKILENRKSISLKKLQKKSLNAYLKATGELEITEKIIKKFQKKLNKMPELEIIDDVITLK